MTEEWMKNQNNAIYTLKLHASKLLQKYPVGKTTIPTAKSANAKEKTNQLAEACSLRILATRKTTKPFPAAVTIESNQPRMLNQLTISPTLLTGFRLREFDDLNEQESRGRLIWF